MLRNLSRKALIHLTQLFNQLLLLGHFPDTWKTAKVISIPKPNKPSTDPNSYRPISLLSTLGKLFELIIAVRLTSFVSQHHLLPHAQFGFRKKHSTVAQLTRITDYVTKGFNLHKHSGMILLDIEKDYDTTPYGYTAFYINSLFSSYQHICFLSLKRSWRDAPSQST